MQVQVQVQYLDGPELASLDLPSESLEDEFHKDGDEPGRCSYPCTAG